jgi:hypothetical protein
MALGRTSNPLRVGAHATGKRSGKKAKAGDERGHHYGTNRVAELLSSYEQARAPTCITFRRTLSRMTI